ncbi:MotA/TolQ/ExbB proton channel family protein [Marinibactrum halimedae]|uniref:Membrane protein n=1 Tax=Marinibactrum halimedae TaxID=1444977 RepID=A0AA37T961_9GAMM|nr:MotA/TolQ/ExbB proton channel family protein [Marinibactrum halimedae]MCD9460567.1 MotA/TolQ/ExbB proton channel family protein [Marinibactrum halimedae]GLS27197.1 membrane protein [Marinibactrum halimedae]
MSEHLRLFFLSLSPDKVTDAFLYVMLAIALITILCRLISVARGFVSHAPSLMTSLGILGTFTGIIIGLFDFSLNDIDQSIAQLLEGLKTAFITSVVGIGLAIVLNIMLRVFPHKASNQSVGFHELQHSLEQIQHTLEVGQRLHNDTLATFLERLSVKASETIVSEMHQVVENFNQRIELQFGENMTQFGKNFSEFDAMVHTLTEEYKRHEDRIAYWSEHCDAAVVGMVQVAKDLQTIHTKLEGLPQFMESSQALIDQAKTQIETVNTQLSNYQTLSQEVSKVMPELGERIDHFVSGIDIVQDIMTGDMKQALVAIHQQSDLLGAQITAISGAFEKMSSLDADFIQSLVAETTTTHRNSMQELAIAQAQTHQEMTDSLSHIIRRSLNESEGVITKQYALIERRMEREIDEVMGTMGQALATISGQFTRDYQQLVDQMQRVMERTRELS